MAAGGDVEARAMGGQVAGVRHATAMEACDDLDACVGKKKRIWKGRRKKKKADGWVPHVIPLLSQAKHRT